MTIWKLNFSTWSQHCFRLFTALRFWMFQFPSKTGTRSPGCWPSRGQCTGISGDTGSWPRRCCGHTCCLSRSPQPCWCLSGTQVSNINNLGFWYFHRPFSASTINARHHLLMRTIGTLPLEDESYAIINYLNTVITACIYSFWSLEMAFYFLFHFKVRNFKSWQILSLDFF